MTWDVRLMNPIVNCDPLYTFEIIGPLHHISRPPFYGENGCKNILSVELILRSAQNGLQYKSGNGLATLRR